MGIEDYEGKYIIFDVDGSDCYVCPLCPTCGKFLKHGEVLINGLGETKMKDWICKSHGEVEPEYMYL